MNLSNPETRAPEVTTHRQEVAATANEFKKIMKTLHRSPDSTTTARAIEAQADILDANDEKGATLLRSVAKLGDYIQGESRLHDLRERRGGNRPTDYEREAERKVKKEKLLPFNDALKDFIYANPGMPLGQAEAVFNAHYYLLFSGKNSPDTSFVADKIASTLNGMRHEIAAEDILKVLKRRGDINDFTYDVTPDQELSAIDILVKCDDDAWVGIDIKASQGGEDGGGHTAIWTGLRNDHFTGIHDEWSGTETRALGVPRKTLEREEILNRFTGRLDQMHALDQHEQDRLNEMRSSRTTLGSKAAKSIISSP